MAKGTTILGILFTLILAGGAFFVGWYYANDWQFSNDPQQITPVIDGIIEKNEWIRSSYNNIPFYLDVDNELDPVENKTNVDGWNYLSVGEDADYYYVAVDLCSDRTNNKNGEWFALNLANRLPDTTYSKLAFYALEDFGYEFFYYNVSDDSVFEDELYTYFPHQIHYDIPIVPETDILEVFRGNITGDFYDIWGDYDDMNITATSRFYTNDSNWLAGNFLDIHFGVNILEKFPDVNITAFTSTLIDMELVYKLQSNLTADPSHFFEADKFHCSIAEHGGEPGDMDSGYFLNNYTPISFNDNIYSIGSVDLNHTNYNPSTGMFYFSIHCWNEVNASHSTGYELQIDKLNLKFTSYALGYVVGNSIASGNYEIAYSYGPSENSPEDHRMFEFKIAKAEFPTLDDEFLYLNIAGYGTLAMEGTNFWMYPMNGDPMPPVQSSITDYRQFAKFDMSIT